jgi:lambda family phage portal protein
MAKQANWYNTERVKQPGSVILKNWNEQIQAQRNLAQRVAKHTAQQRSFQGGLPSRLTSGFNAFNTSLDTDLYTSLNTLRARSRQLIQNNPYGQKFVRMVASNVVGQGFTLQNRAMDGSKPDTADAKAIEDAFTAWSRRGICDVTGQLSFAELCRLVMRTVACDGEVLIRKVRGRAINKFGFSLQVLDIDRLLVQDQRKFDNGNMMRMGVEINSYGKPVAYWVRSAHPADPFMQSSSAPVVERIPADEIFHFFIPMRPEQRRGVPWMHAAIERLYHIGELDQSALIAARKGADTLGFFVSPNGLPPDTDGSGTNSAPIEVSVPGTFDTLPEGYDIKNFDSKYPNDVYPAFIKSALRAVASALGVAYNGLANDLEGVNYSSIRSGVLEEREFWMELQDWFTSAFLIPLYDDWLQLSLGMGAITSPAGFPLPATKFVKFSAHEWQGRRWGWVDPLGDLQASVLAINNGLKSRSRICAEMGMEREQVWAELAREEEEMQAMKLNLAGPPAANPSAAQLSANNSGSTPAQDAELKNLRDQVNTLAQRQPNITVMPPNVDIKQGDVHVSLPEGCINLEATINTPEVRAGDVHVSSAPAQVVVAHPTRATQTIERDPDTLEATRTIINYEMQGVNNG